MNTGMGRSCIGDVITDRINLSGSYNIFDKYHLYFIIGLSDNS